MQSNKKNSSCKSEKLWVNRKYAYCYDVHTYCTYFPTGLEGFEREAHTTCRDVQWNTSNYGKRGEGV